MSDEKSRLSRRSALKIIGAGVGAAGALSLYRNPVFAQHDHMKKAAAAHAEAAKGEKPRFFTPAELATVAVLSELIIPADDHSPGAKAAGVPAFIDLMVNELPRDVQRGWREGLAALDATSRKRSGRAFSEAATADQIALLTAISRNEMSPKTVEEHLFRSVKLMTIDGYYTSEAGIHEDLAYKGGGFSKEFVGCTHPDHLT